MTCRALPILNCVVAVLPYHVALLQQVNCWSSHIRLSLQAIEDVGEKMLNAIRSCNKPKVCVGRHNLIIIFLTQQLIAL